MEEHIWSAGFDIGTTTTQLVLSRLTLEKTAGYGLAPRVKVTEREVRYRSPVAFTALDEQDAIDGDAAVAFLKSQYESAGISPEDIGTGAVIITGESAKKRNAHKVIEALSAVAGDFVVAAAGPDLESTLAGKGAGADDASVRLGRSVLNLDIGGGTSNLCLFEDGEEKDSACTNIGGRLVRVGKDGVVQKMTPQIEDLIEKLGLPIKVGEPLSIETARQLTDTMADILAQTAGLKEMTPLGKSFLTNHGMSSDSHPECLMFSGGVSDCMAHPDMDPFTYGDIGPLLARSILEHPAFQACPVVPARETMRATVIGAGTCSMDVSGSTIACEGITFPLKNIPVLPLKYEGEEDLPALQGQIANAMERYKDTDSLNGAFFLKGPVSPGFREVEGIADLLAPVIAEKGRQGAVFPVVVEHDFAKALGQSIRRRVGREVPVLCLDGIHCKTGDYIDIGAPVGGGICVPVVVKTLLFQKKGDSE
ncbi:MAG: ethanolamine ammonia-lyase reactivating factor EutA [Acutalibacteraceae bacterium]|nr:ethanolamine ammonia-lyase reactivating factor EutA [Acutalibacteraceae bacterium]